METQAKQIDNECRDREMNEELADVLTAISVVSKRLARKLTMLSRQDEKRQKEENRMSKMSELSLAVKELKRCGEALISISESLTDLFSGNGDAHTSDHPKTEVTELVEKPITLEAVRAVLAVKSRTGHTAKVREQLEKHVAKKLSEIDPAEYPALLEEAEVLGNG